MEPLFKEKLSKIEIFINENRLNEAEKLLEELYQEAVSNNDSELMGYASNYLGNIAFDKGFFQKSFDNYNRSYAEFKKINDSKGLIHALNGLSLLFSQTGDFRNALKYMLEVNNIVNSEKAFEIHRFFAINNIALLFINLKEYDLALKYLNECRKLCRDSDDKKLNAIVTFNIAEIYFYKKDYEKSRKYLEKSRKESVLVDDFTGLSFCKCLDAALIYSKTKDILSAEKMFRSAVSESYKYGTKYDVLDVYSIFYRSLYRDNDYEEVKIVLNEALKLAVEIKSYVKQKEIYEMLNVIYYKEGDYKNAYVSLVKKQEIVDISDGIIENIQINYLSETYSNETSKLQMEEMEDSINTLKALAELGKAITASIDINKIFQMLISSLPNILKLNSFGIAIMDRESNELEYYFYDDKTGTTYEKYDLDNDSILMNLTIKQNKEIVIFNTKNIKEYKNKYSEELVKIIFNSDSRSLIFCPLIYNDQVIGGVTAQSHISHTFSYKNLEVLRIMASFVSVALTNYIKTKTLEKISRLDGLTLLYNRYALSEYLEKYISIYDEKDMPLAVFMLDIDYFKQYNDNYGHVQGDYCIKSIANIILKEVNKHKGRVFRYGGDEFLIIIENTSYESCENIIKNIFIKLKNKNMEHLFSKVSKRVTITVGAVIIYEEASNYKNLCHSADEALYEAKNKGRNTYLIRG